MTPKKGLLLWGLILMLALALALGCSDDDEEDNTPTDDGNGTNPVTTTTIGPDGGYLQITGQAVLSIAAGSLDTTIEFSIQQNLSPAALPDGFFASNVYTIEPSGTQFSNPAGLSLTYSESKLGKPFDTSLQIYTYDGSSWDSLPTVVDSANHMAVASITHLSDFAVHADTGGTSGGDDEFSATLVAGRLLMWEEGWTDPFIMDELVARFDSSLTPCSIVNPQQADSVHCNEFDLVWSTDTRAHTYTAFPDMDFLGYGTNYVFHVYGNAAVPSLTDSITFPSLQTYLTSPFTGATVSRLTDLVLTWSGSGIGTYVSIFIGPSQSGTVTDTTMYLNNVPNSGTYTISSAQMGAFAPGEYGIILIHQNRKSIDAPGYNSEASFIAGRVINAITITLE